MIALTGVTVRFPAAPPPTLRERVSGLLGSARPAVREPVTALRSIDLRVGRGERLGVVGLNGAGKTTLLKVICGIYPPAAGTVVVEGEVASLFELATGFEMEATGWENIVTRGMLLGLTRREIRDRLGEIASFTDLGPALDRPVKTYSSGMFVRLAFAVSTAISPDVLLLDEVIAAGDIRFRDKARRRLQAMVARASTTVLISHSFDTVVEMCDRAIWLHEGQIRLDGSPREVTGAYANMSTGSG